MEETEEDVVDAVVEAPVAVASQEEEVEALVDVVVHGVAVVADSQGVVEEAVEGSVDAVAASKLSRRRSDMSTCNFLLHGQRC